MAEADDPESRVKGRKPLEGVRVIDIASFLAGPIGAMFTD